MAALPGDVSEKLSLSGKVALVTGASSGIGAGTAILFAKLGAKLALNGRNVDNLSEVGKVCEDAGQCQPLLLPGDLTDEATVKKVVEETINHYGQLDVLVNSAGILLMGTIETTTMEDYDKIMNVNLRSIYHLTRLAVPHLIHTKGCIVNVSSVNGQRSFPGVVVYCMSKAALDQFTRCLALATPQNSGTYYQQTDQQASPTPPPSKALLETATEGILTCRTTPSWGKLS
ncbi:3-oxoacyl-[acyl-carrier-protein] reductase FabG isoform X3 [Scyliorhinus torazame]|uniref:3-oxoacyl-[acyl-carrier-protein] reductase FabG isoform X3 n=1 Tax=Scyliorhinus torazame TaxID=75743 RepID=UPI003B5D03D7